MPSRQEMEVDPGKLGLSGLLPSTFSPFLFSATSQSDPGVEPERTWGHNTGMGSLSLLQGIFQTQGSNPGLSHSRQIIYQLSHKGSPNIIKFNFKNLP